MFDFPAFTLSQADWNLAETDPDPLFRSAAESVRDHRDAIHRTCPSDWSPEAWQQLAILQTGVAMLLRSHGITPDCVTGDGPGRTVVPLFHPVDATGMAAGDTVITVGPGAADTSVLAWRSGLAPGHGALLAIAALFDAGHGIRRR